MVLSRRRISPWLCAMTFIDLATGWWFEIVEVLYIDEYCTLGETVVNKSKEVTEYLQKILESKTLDKSSARISQLFNQVWLSRNPMPRWSCLTME